MNYSPLYSPFPTHGIITLIIVIAIVWTIVLKGFALWYSARGHQKWWFIVLLVLNTLGILEIIYLIWFRPKTTDTASVVHHSSGM